MEAKEAKEAKAKEAKRKGEAAKAKAENSKRGKTRLSREQFKGEVSKVLAKANVTKCAARAAKVLAKEAAKAIVAGAVLGPLGGAIELWEAAQQVRRYRKATVSQLGIELKALTRQLIKKHQALVEKAYLEGRIEKVQEAKAALEGEKAAADEKVAGVSAGASDDSSWRGVHARALDAESKRMAAAVEALQAKIDDMQGEEEEEENEDVAEAKEQVKEALDEKAKALVGPLPSWMVLPSPPSLPGFPQLPELPGYALPSTVAELDSMVEELKEKVLTRAWETVLGAVVDGQSLTLEELPDLMMVVAITAMWWFGKLKAQSVMKQKVRNHKERSELLNEREALVEWLDQLQSTDKPALEASKQAANEDEVQALDAAIADLDELIARLSKQLSINEAKVGKLDIEDEKLNSDLDRFEDEESKEQEQVTREDKEREEFAAELPALLAELEAERKARAESEAKLRAEEEKLRAEQKKAQFAEEEKVSKEGGAGTGFQAWCPMRAE